MHTSVWQALGLRGDFNINSKYSASYTDNSPVRHPGLMSLTGFCTGTRWVMFSDPVGKYPHRLCRGQWKAGAWALLDLWASEGPLPCHLSPGSLPWICASQLARLGEARRPCPGLISLLPEDKHHCQLEAEFINLRPQPTRPRWPCSQGNGTSSVYLIFPMASS